MHKEKEQVHKTAGIVKIKESELSLCNYEEVLAVLDSDTLQLKKTINAH